MEVLRDLDNNGNECLGHSSTLPKYSEWVDKKFAEENYLSQLGFLEYYLMCEICQGFFPFTLTNK